MESALAITHNKQELENLEAIIERGLSTFYEVGHALMRIRDEELYEKVRGISNFKTYCKDRWGMSIRHAERLMGSAAVVENTRPIGRVPDSESVARVISSLLPEQQCATWQKAVETAPEGKITAAHVSKVVKEMTGGPPKPYVLKKHEPIIKQELISEEFQVAYDEMVIALRNASETKWKETSYKGALELMKTLLTLTEQMGM